MAQDTGAVPFGYKLGWLAVRGRTPEQVAAALGLESLRPVPWLEGLERVSEDGEGQYFLPPVLDGWTLVASEDLLSEASRDPDSPRAFADRVATLSARLGEVQAFATSRVIEYHHWMRAVDGALRRAYAYLGESGEVQLDAGAVTPEEEALRAGDPEWTPGEQDVMALAGRWSVDPSGLEGHPAGAQPGLHGWRAGAAPGREPAPPPPRRPSPEQEAADAVGSVVQGLLRKLFR
ncbi:hypothetical protein FGE12_10530 [Aggregicoccus sp. 17bor-14]|uniref:hypothetical protein n=1 Tax=Myxococcaceae TaxID=31 RepID=UPI00129CB4E3|nr:MULTISPECIES: hypothetical protein [Myxococcaceae]MBF5042829.1 hypothetical protein [Simulacricoccus sp. 17bor-14]MRI88597.1 hypothetical protein [Aggregicoccus sp. 17bor-14]